MILIYSSKSSPRLLYVLQLYFRDLIKSDLRITTDENVFLSSESPKLNYSKKRFGSECFLYAEDLLFENGIHEQKISIGEWQGIKTLFSHKNESDLSFDPFAAAFYLVTRYEEYLPFVPDEHGRFPEKESIGFKNGFHETPVVNHYAIFLKEILLKKFPQLNFENPSYQFQLTYDIDFAFAYHAKGLLRNAGGFAREIIEMDWEEMAQRTKVLFGKQNDPFDTFDFQFSLHKKFNLHPVYFFLLGDYGKLDKNISWENHSLQHLIRRIAETTEIGIHSSYASNLQPQKIKTEIERLEKISGKKIFRNRQHFLKLKFPSTYQNLISAGITEDYTMGFASQVGFRAGISSQFFWYDLSKEEITSLRIFPFAVMDATLYYYLKLSSEDASQKTKQLIEEVKKVGGYFQFLAHNDLLSEKLQWKGWHQKFEELLGTAH